MSKLPREFYLREDTLQIARELLGKILVVPDAAGERVAGVIVETEAYLGAIDKAAHSYGNRRTARTEIMFGEGARAYVFFIYGMYFQLNVITGAADAPHCVLIRAVEPVEGVEIMRIRRGAMKDKNLTSGPGKLCIALGIDKTLNGADLLGERIWIEEGKRFSDGEIASGKRVGIDYAEEFAEKPWRFWVKDNTFVSRK
jgi:DNA-3-methyladenine glycosylase